MFYELILKEFMSCFMKLFEGVYELFYDFILKEYIQIYLKNVF